MNARRVEITLPQERWDALEAARGHEPRASFIKRALESALGDAVGQSRKPSMPGVSPAPTRASTTDPELQGLKNIAETVGQDYRERIRSRAERLPPGVKSARELAMERQRKMNERKS